MGLDISSSKLNITNSSGEIKFSTERKMPHILYSVTGTFAIPTIVPSGSALNYFERADEQILITNSLINNSNYFILPFYKITGGPAASGGASITGGGSVILRIIRHANDGSFLGSSILETVVSSGVLKLVCYQNLNRATDYNNALPIVGDDIVSVDYRVYYGRFQ
jgi:hypothetical protein